MSDHADFTLMVAYGTDTGNAEDAAVSFANAAQAAGMGAEAVELNQVELSELAAATHLVVVCATFGEGEFPDNALLFWEALSSEGADRLENLKYAILALGDSSYEFFANAGKLLDRRLEELGATRLTDRVDADGFYDQPAAAFTADVVRQLQEEQAGTPGSTATTNTLPPASSLPATQSARERHRLADGRLTVNRRINAETSDKEVRHFEIDLTGLGISYAAGDSLAVQVVNDPLLVEALHDQLGVGPDATVEGHEQPLGVLLSEHLEIRTPPRALQALVAQRTLDPSAAAALAACDCSVLGSWGYGKDVLDLIKLADLTLDEVVNVLRPLQYRDYSIASSPVVYPNQAHLTVTTVRYETEERKYGGAGSTFLADRVTGDQILRVQLRPNHFFRLPAPEIPIIMVGPGTGIAPFRGFLQERDATGATGPSWLFFGDRRRDTDFLYADELEAYVQSKTLTRLDLAFSRDCTDGAKQYVQQRMLANGSELYAWLQNGAYFYVCGDEKYMARDVDATLHEIVAKYGEMDEAAAHAYVNDLIKSHRYVRDVY